MKSYTDHFIMPLEPIWSVLDLLVNCNLVRAYACVQKLDITCLSETQLDSRINDESLEISRYFFIYLIKIVVILVFNIKTLFLYKYPISTFLINPLLSVWISITRFRSHCQSLDHFAMFLLNFELTLDSFSKNNPSLLVVISNLKYKNN